MKKIVQNIFLAIKRIEFTTLSAAIMTKARMIIVKVITALMPVVKKPGMGMKFQ